MSQGFEQPRVITYGELVQKVYPFIQGYHWAEDTIRDLWNQCTPTPDQILDPNNIQNEKRILNAAQFKAWWEDVCQRQGIPLTPAQVIPVVRTH